MSQRRDEPHGTTRTALARTVQAGPMTPLSVHCSRIPGLGAGQVSVRPGRGSRLLAPGLWPCHVRTHWPVMMSPPGLLAHRKLSVNIRAWKFPVAAVTTHCELRGLKHRKLFSAVWRPRSRCRLQGWFLRQAPGGAGPRPAARLQVPAGGPWCPRAGTGITALPSHGLSWAFPRGLCLSPPCPSAEVMQTPELGFTPRAEMSRSRMRRGHREAREAAWRGRALAEGDFGTLSRPAAQSQ